MLQSTAYFNPTVAHSYEEFYSFCAVNNFFLTKENGLPYNFTYFTGRYEMIIINAGLQRSTMSTYFLLCVAITFCLVLLMTQNLYDVQKFIENLKVYRTWTEDINDYPNRCNLCGHAWFL